MDSFLQKRLETEELFHFLSLKIVEDIFLFTAECNRFIFKVMSASGRVYYDSNHFLKGVVVECKNSINIRRKFKTSQGFSFFRIKGIFDALVCLFLTDEE